MAQLSPSEITKLARRLERAEFSVSELQKITAEHPQMDLQDAYDIQWAIRRNKASRGVRIVGMKLGLASEAAMRQHGIEQPIYGFLADYFERVADEPIDIENLIHPKVEPELGFILNKTLRGPNCQIADVLAATQYLVPALEIIDSRYQQFALDLRSTVADNSACARFVLGDRHPLKAAWDIPALGVALYQNDQLVANGSGAAVMGHPAASVAHLVNMLAERGEVLATGSLVLSGGMTAAVSVQPGDQIRAQFQILGDMQIQFHSR